MAGDHRRHTHRSGHGQTLARAGRYCTRAGVAVIALAAPLLVVTILLVSLDAPTFTGAIDAVGAAVSGPIGLGGGLPWALHLGFLGVLAGTWLVGLGYVLTGLYD